MVRHAVCSHSRKGKGASPVDRVDRSRPRWTGPASSPASWLRRAALRCVDAPDRDEQWRGSWLGMLGVADEGKSGGPEAKRMRVGVDSLARTQQNRVVRTRARRRR